MTQSAKLSEMMASVDTEEGRRRVIDFLNTQSYPHYEAAPDQPDLLIRIEASGMQTQGRFLGGVFVPENPEGPKERSKKRAT